MTRIYICLFFALLISFANTDDPKKGDVGIYVSPHGITRQTEVHTSLQSIASKIVIAETKYQYGNINYTISNATVEVTFLDAKQVVEIINNNTILVSGGVMEFSYKFNYSKYGDGQSIGGWAQGSVVSESFNYTKQLAYLNDGHLHWTLAPSEQGYTKLAIGQRMKIKRMSPYHEDDYDNLLAMLDRAASLITPSNVETQLLSQFNQYMPIALNQTLQKTLLDPVIEYKYHSPTHGQIGMTIENQLWGYNIDPEDGYKLKYFSAIRGEQKPCIDEEVPEKHLGFSFYGGHQTIYLNCFYNSVLQYLQKKGWLNIKLDTSWDCNAFQFYAGDLFDLINNLYLQVSPRELLEGQCTVKPGGLEMKYLRDSANLYQVNTVYTCIVRSRHNTEKTTIDVMNFTADVKFFIKADCGKTELYFSIDSVEALNLQFVQVGQFYVNNRNLALFKVNQILNNLKKLKVFGNGYPTPSKALPKTHLSDDGKYAVYYDAHTTKDILVTEM